LKMTRDTVTSSTVDKQGSKESDATTVLPAKTGRCSQNVTAVTIVCPDH